MAAKIQSGIDFFLSQFPIYQHHRLALVTNDAATTAAFENSRLALLKSGFRIVKLFTPEHGLSAQGADGVFQENKIDELTGLPVISLYGDHLSPAEQDLVDVDVVVFDIPDIGCRFYTYQWTLSYVMESCARNNKPLIVLDRPNPTGGDLSMAEGPWLDLSCASFIGRWDIPLKHACTVGELAGLWKKQQRLDFDLRIVPAHGRQGEMDNAFFIPTSPGIPDRLTAQLYPGMGLLEGINVSEGRGTTMPFKIVGAPWIKSGDLADKFNSMGLPGVIGMPFSFQPAWSKYSGTHCNGLMLVLTDASEFRPVNTGLRLINLLCNEYPAEIGQHAYPTRANPTGLGHLDKLMGVRDSFRLLQEDKTVFREQVSSLTSCDGWKEIISDFLLYRREG